MTALPSPLPAAALPSPLPAAALPSPLPAADPQAAALPAAALIDAARTHGLRIATAESCTGGMISAALTDVAGSSEVFDCGLVTYSNAAKVALLGVGEATLARAGAVSEAVVAEMAAGVLARSGAHLSVAVSGVAGPGASGAKPEGRVCFALARRGAPPHTETVEFGPRGRAAVREATVAHALALLEGAIAAG